MSGTIETRAWRSPSRSRTRRSARLRDRLGLGALLLGCCSEAYDYPLDVLTFVDGAEGVELRRLETGRLGSWNPLQPVDLNYDGADEVLLASRDGLLWLRDDEAPRVLWSGRYVKAAEWVEPTSRHEGRIVMLVVPDAFEPPVLRQIACSASDVPVCAEESQAEVDSEATALVAADFDEDDVADVLTWGSNRIALLRGVMTDDGEVTWPSREHFADSRTSTHLEGRHSVAAADLDDDGHVDVVAAQAFHPNGVMVYFGDGLGGWDEVVGELEGNCAIDGIYIAPVTDDPHLDIVADCELPTVFVNLGERSFHTVEPAGREALVDEIVPVRVAGGRVSLLTWSSDEDVAQLLESSDGSTWGIRTVPASFEEAHEIEGMAADLDGDSVDEIVVVQTVPEGCQ